MRVVTEIHRSEGSDRNLGPRFETMSLILALVLTTCFAILPKSSAAGWGVRSSPNYPQQVKSSVDYQAKTLSGQLNLTPEQRIKVRKILEVRQARLTQIRRNSMMSAVDRFNLMRAVHDRTNQEIRNLLNEEQAKKFDQLSHYRPPTSSAPPPAGSSH